MRVLGVLALYHNCAAALIEDGHIVAAAQEERSHRLEDAELVATCAEDSAQGKALEWFKERMGFGPLRGEPIVGSPKDAFRCFMDTGLDAPAVGNRYLCKENQNPALKQNYEIAFELD